MFLESSENCRFNFQLIHANCWTYPGDIVKHLFCFTAKGSVLLLMKIAAKAGAKAGASLGIAEAHKSGANAGAKAGYSAGAKAGAEAGVKAATDAATKVATQTLKIALAKLGLPKPVSFNNSW